MTQPTDQDSKDGHRQAIEKLEHLRDEARKAKQKEASVNGGFEDYHRGKRDAFKEALKVVRDE